MQSPIYKRKNIGMAPPGRSVGTPQSRGTGAGNCGGKWCAGSFFPGVNRSVLSLVAKMIKAKATVGYRIQIRKIFRSVTLLGRLLDFQRRLCHDSKV